ncbi:MAG: malonyl-ACP O-methyltransferase BioC [Gammaproteobacteria bacterium]
MMSVVFELDKSKIKQAFGAAHTTYDGLADLQREIGLTLIEHGRLVSDMSGTGLDLGCGTGFMTRELLQQGAFEQMLALDIALPMLQRARCKLSGSYDVVYLCADAERPPLAEKSVDSIFSNLALQWCRDLETLCQACHYVLKPSGSMNFSIFGPNTLCELKQAWAAVDRFRHVNDFVGPDELHRVLRRAGFSAVNIEILYFRPVYPSVRDLMLSLKGIGAHNVASGRIKTMTGKGRLRQMMAAYPAALPDGSITATYEAIIVTACF